MSGAARDGWAIKGPDGVLRARTFKVEGPEWPWNNLPSREFEEINALATLPEPQLGEPMGRVLAEFERNARRLGYSLVPVRLVEIDDEKEGC